MEESSVDVNVFNPFRANKSNDAGPTEGQSAVPSSRPTIDINSFFYDMSGEKFLLIFNHYSYEKTVYYGKKPPPSRKGTEQDVRKLKDIFDELGFKVLVYHDKKYSEILTTIKNISQQDHSRTSCLFIAILTHGEKGGELFASDRPYKFSDLTSLLENGHDSLVNKPKVFFLQACRGHKLDSGRTVYYDGEEHDESNTVVLPSPADFLIMYSSAEDYVGFRDPNGSWLIQELCNVLKEYHTEMDILQILTIVIRKIAFTRVSYNPKDPSKHDKKQIPEILSRLTKFLKFNYNNI